MTVVAQALSLQEFDEKVFAEAIRQIEVPGHNRLVFHFKNGRSQEMPWQHPSRSRSWDESMRQTARERQLAMMEEREKK